MRADVLLEVHTLSVGSRAGPVSLASMVFDGYSGRRQETVGAESVVVGCAVRSK